MSLITWLKRPYPLIIKTSQKLLLAISFAIFVYGFLLIYQPFGASEVKEYKALFLSGFAACVFTGLVLTYIVLPAILPSVFNPDKWIVKKEILYIFLSFLVIATFNYFYNDIVGKNIAKPQSFPKFIGITVSIGFFPVLGLIFLTERYLKERNEGAAKAISSQLEKPIITNSKGETITLQSETTKSDVLSIDIKDFLFAKAEDNYSIVHFISQQKPQKKMLRLSLKTIENLLEDHDEIVRCHKSFILNKNYITSVKGNARSLFIEIEQSDVKIPVSRSFPREKLV